MQTNKSRPSAGATQAKPVSPPKPSSEPKLKPGANLMVAPKQPAPGKPAKVTLTLTDKSGAKVDQLASLHTKPVHLIAVSEDLTDFIHTHPVRKPNGTYVADVNFKTPSNYRLWTEFQPKGASGATTDVADVATKGAVPTMVTLAVDSANAKTVGNTTVKLHGGEALKAGKLATLHFDFEDARSGSPAKLSPLLGAAGHAIVISSDRSKFMHLHGEAMDGQMPSSGGHGAHGAPASTVQGSRVAFAARFPEPGLYRVFAQVSRDGKTVTVPFTVRVS